MKKVWLIALIFIAIDQFTKIYVKLNFTYGDYERIFSMFTDSEHGGFIRFIENPGMAYGIEIGGYNGKVALTIIRFILISGGIIYIHKLINKTTSNFFKIPIAFILAGAIGNLIDSLFYGMIFDKGLVYDTTMQAFSAYDYTGLAQANFQGYSGFLGGCVVDMLHFPLFTFDLPSWIPIGNGDNNSFTFFSPVFNVADSCITVGIVLLFIFKNKALPEGFKW